MVGPELRGEQDISVTKAEVKGVQMAPNSEETNVVIEQAGNELKGPVKNEVKHVVQVEHVRSATETDFQAPAKHVRQTDLDTFQRVNGHQGVNRVQTEPNLHNGSMVQMQPRQQTEPNQLEYRAQPDLLRPVIGTPVQQRHCHVIQGPAGMNSRSNSISQIMYATKQQSQQPYYQYQQFQPGDTQPLLPQQVQQLIQQQQQQQQLVHPQAGYYTIQSQGQAASASSLAGSRSSLNKMNYNTPNNNINKRPVNMYNTMPSSISLHMEQIERQGEKRKKRVPSCCNGNSWRAFERALFSLAVCCVKCIGPV